MSPEALSDRFSSLQAAARSDGLPDAKRRRLWLDALSSMLANHLPEWERAISQDFGHRSAHETRLEAFQALTAIRHARRYLKGWMKPRRRGISWIFLPARVDIRYQPLGVVGVLVPWNYPIFLSFGPMVDALAAGNRLMVKMSEFAPQTATLMANLARQYFADDVLQIVEGDAVVAQAFSHLPFDHLLFTGSTDVGRQVMRAAAGQLTPVTLELGGKSPLIVSPDYPLAHMVERLLVGKCINAGQTCVAPDYLLLPAGQEQALIDAARQAMSSLYPDFSNNPDYSSIVNDRQFSRLQDLLEDAKGKGAKIVELCPGQPPDVQTRRFAPVLIFEVTDEMRVTQEELFGPLLPVITYTHLAEAIAYVAARPRPLALYVFDRDSARLEQILNGIVAGGVTVNDTILHLAQHDLPFGGVGASGMGHYHGHDGFIALSKQTGVFRQSRWNGVGLLKPPYGGRFDRLLRFLTR